MPRCIIAFGQLVRLLQSALKLTGEVILTAAAAGVGLLCRPVEVAMKLPELQGAPRVGHRLSHKSSVTPQVTYLEKSGHSGHLEEPQLCSEHILEFVNNC